MGLITEFKEFISRGNVVDLAVGVVIGAAFGKIVTALVDGIVMPAIGAFTKGVSVSDWKYVIKPAQLDSAGKEVAAELAIRYGMFVQTIIDFLLIALVIFLILKAYNRVRAPAAAPAVSEEVLLLREIRDELKSKG
jgi:large conductance mechanosensitive channel